MESSAWESEIDSDDDEHVKYSLNEIQTGTLGISQGESDDLAADQSYDEILCPEPVISANPDDLGNAFTMPNKNVVSAEVYPAPPNRRGKFYNGAQFGGKGQKPVIPRKKKSNKSSATKDVKASKVISLPGNDVSECTGEVMGHGSSSEDLVEHSSDEQVHELLDDVTLVHKNSSNNDIHSGNIVHLSDKMQPKYSHTSVHTMTHQRHKNKTVDSDSSYPSDGNSDIEKINVIKKKKKKSVSFHTNKPACLGNNHINYESSCDETQKRVKKLKELVDIKAQIDLIDKRCAEKDRSIKKVPLHQKDDSDIIAVLESQIKLLKRNRTATNPCYNAEEPSEEDLPIAELHRSSLHSAHNSLRSDIHKPSAVNTATAGPCSINFRGIHQKCFKNVSDALPHQIPRGSRKEKGRRSSHDSDNSNLDSDDPSDDDFYSHGRHRNSETFRETDKTQVNKNKNDETYWEDPESEIDRKYNKSHHETCDRYAKPRGHNGHRFSHRNRRNLENEFDNKLSRMVEPIQNSSDSHIIRLKELQLQIEREIQSHKSQSNYPSHIIQAKDDAARSHISSISKRSDSCATGSYKKSNKIIVPSYCPSDKSDDENQSRRSSSFRKYCETSRYEQPKANKCFIWKSSDESDDDYQKYRLSSTGKTRCSEYEPNQKSVRSMDVPSHFPIEKIKHIPKHQSSKHNKTLQSKSKSFNKKERPFYSSGDSDTSHSRSNSNARNNKSRERSSRRSSPVCHIRDSKSNLSCGSKGRRNRKEWIIPEKYDPNHSWSSFLAKFQVCCEYNGWHESDKIAYMISSLKGTAEQIIWAEGVTQWTYDELVDKLDKRYGSQGQGDSFRAELAKRYRGRNESLLNYFQDISRLIGLAYEGPRSSHTNLFAIEAFLKGLGNDEIAVKIREREPVDLDDAFRMAKRLESYSSCSSRNKNYDDYDGRKDRQGYAKSATETKKKVTYADQAEEIKKLKEQLAVKEKQELNIEKQQHLIPQNPTFISNPNWISPSNETMMKTPLLPIPTPLMSNWTPNSPSATANQQWNNRPTEGYLSRDSSRNRDGSARLCFYCKQSGHFRNSCPQLQQERNQTSENNINGARMTRDMNEVDETAQCVNAIGGKIVRKTFITAKLFGVDRSCMLDSGSDFSIFPDKFVKGQRMYKTRKILKAANGTAIPLLGEVRTSLKIGDLTFSTNALVSKMTDEILLGYDWLSQHKVSWTLGDDHVVVSGQSIELSERTAKCSCRRIWAQCDSEVPPNSETHLMANVNVCHSYQDVNEDWVTEPVEIKKGLWVARTVLPHRRADLPIRVMNITDQTVTIKQGSQLTEAVPADIVDETQSEIREESTPEFPEKLLEKVHESVSQDDKEILKNLLQTYSDVFSHSEYDLGCTGLAKHNIDTGANKPIKQALRRQPFAHQPIIDEQVKSMLENGIIEKSQSPWASNVVIVKKKDGTSRFCVDYRGLNELTRKDAYPLPRIDTCLDTLGGAKYFSTFDLRSGYHQIEMAVEDADKTSFVTRLGTFRFKVLPFGLCNAGASFQRVMDVALSGLNFEILLVYLDDIILFSESISSHLLRLEQLFQRLRFANLKLKPSKCYLLQTEVAFLGHQVSSQGIATDPFKIEMVKEWPVPKNLTEVRSFVGLASYYRRFVLNFSEIACPLYALMNKDHAFIWSEECQKAFETMKDRLTTAPVLAMPLDNGEYILDTDASYGSVGAVLSQIQDGQERVIAYASRTLNGPEKNYCVTRKELLAIVYYMKAFKQYLLGKPFIVRTDHAALTWLQKTPIPIGQQARWLNILGEFDYKVIHRAGKSHQNADALSRRPCRQCGIHPDEISEPELRLCRISLADKDVLPDCPWNKIEIAKETILDEDLQIVHQWLQGNAKPSDWKDVSNLNKVVRMFWRIFNDLVLVEGIIFRKHFGNEKSCAQLLMIPPKNKRPEIISLAHTGMEGGHMGKKKTLQKLKRLVYWPDMNLDVKTHIQRCVPCARYKRGVAPRQGLMQNCIPGEVWSRISIDITGPHPISKRGHRFILTAIDQFSKWSEAWPIRNHEATTVAHILCDQLFCRFGIPTEILSDQGREFESVLFQELCRVLEIDKLRTSAYRPNCNGSIERFHRTLNSMIAKVVDVEQKNWDLQIPFVLAAYRATQHESTGFTPNYLQLGREVRTPLDLALGCSTEEAEHWDSHIDFVYDKQRKLRSAFETTREHLGKAVEIYKKSYDTKVNMTTFKVGDWVYYYLPKKVSGKSAKWQLWYTGPYLVTQVLGAVNYRIQKSAGGRNIVSHVDKLKLCHGTHPSSWLPPTETLVTTFDVEKRNHRDKERNCDRHENDLSTHLVDDEQFNSESYNNIKYNLRSRQSIARPSRFGDSSDGTPC